MNHFERLYATILAHPKTADGARGAFYARYYQAIAAEKRQLDVALSLSPTTPGQRS